MIANDTPSQQQNTVKTWQFKDLLVELYLYVPGPAELIPKHSHEEYQIGFTYDCTGGYFYRGTSYPVPAGSFSVIHTGEVHNTTRKTTQLEVYRTIWMLLIKPTLFEALVEELTERSTSLPFFQNPVITDSELTSRFLKFHSVVGMVGSQLEVECLKLDFVSLLLQRYADIRISPKPLLQEHKRVQMVREYLEEHLTENVSLESLAQLVGFSPFHLNRVFRQEVGLPPHHYQTQVRIERAKALIRKGLPLRLVASESGFTDVSHLTRHFKRFAQVTPGRYLPQK